jgi:hypothetical protein
MRVAGMKKIVIGILWLFSYLVAGAAQKSASELVPAHASALQVFLSSHPNLDFMSEKSIDPDYLKFMRKHLGARLTPFYQKGDFNGDGRPDFALILAREGPHEDQGPDIAEGHRYRYPITIVIFNGMKGGAYKAVFVKNITAPLVCFLNTTGGRKKRLYFGITETDESFSMTPAGKGYIVEY